MPCNCAPGAKPGSGVSPPVGEQQRRTAAAAHAGLATAPPAGVVGEQFAHPRPSPPWPAQAGSAVRSAASRLAAVGHREGDRGQPDAPSAPAPRRCGRGKSCTRRCSRKRTSCLAGCTLTSTPRDRDRGTAQRTDGGRGTARRRRPGARRGDHAVAHQASVDIKYSGRPGRARPSADRPSLSARPGTGMFDAQAPAMKSAPNTIRSHGPLAGLVAHHRAAAAAQACHVGLRRNSTPLHQGER